MRVVGLTGGVACGKSLAADCAARHGIPVIDTDHIAREVIAPGSPLLDAIRARFGDAVFDGPLLNRAALRRQVFADPARRIALESLLHPAIRARARAQLAALAGSSLVLLVVPLLAEHYDAWRELVDRVLVIDCATALQRARLAARDHADPALIDAMLAAQADRDTRRRIADAVILNDADPEQLCTRLHAQLELWRAA